MPVAFFRSQGADFVAMSFFWAKYDKIQHFSDGIKLIQWH